MIRPLALLVCLSMLVAGCGDTRPPEAPVAANDARSAPPETVAKTPDPEPLPDTVRVRLETAAGAITVALDARRAPITTANFVRYVDDGRFDDTAFYRAAPTRSAGGETIAGRGFIQGGIRRDYRRMFPPIDHEPTSETGLRHEAGTVSMARSATSGAMGDFFITTSAMPSMDAKGGEPGFAAFGRVVEGMDVVRSILAAPTVPNAGRGAMRGQMIAKPVRITSARRVE